MRLRCDAQIGSPSMSQAAPESPTSGRRKDKSPRVPHCPSAGIGGGVGGKLAVELAQKRDAVGEAKLGAGSTWNAAASVGPLTQSCAQANRARSVSTALGLIASRRSKRAPNSLRESVPVRPLYASAKPPP